MDSKLRIYLRCLHWHQGVPFEPSDLFDGRFWPQMMGPQGAKFQQAGALPMAPQQQQQQGATPPPGPPGPPGAPAPPPAPLAANYPVPQVSAPQPQQQRQVCQIELSTE